MDQRLTLLCQAPTAATHAAAFPGDDDADPRWLAKVARSRARFQRFGVCVTGPGRAAQQTAAALALASVTEPALRECGYGRWTGRAFVDIAAEDPVGLSSWLSEPTSRPHGGEAIADQIERARAWLTAVKLAASDLVIVPASIVKTIVIAALEAPSSAFHQLDVSPVSVTRLRRISMGWAVVSLNQRLSMSGDIVDEP